MFVFLLEGGGAIGGGVIGISHKLLSVRFPMMMASSFLTTLTSYWENMATKLSLYS